MRARVFGATTAGVAASMPLGALLGGLAVDAFGITATVAGAALLYLVFGGSPLFLRSFSGLTAARGHGGAAVAESRDDDAEVAAEASAAPLTPGE
jgi:hypothetical protein